MIPRHEVETRKRTIHNDLIRFLPPSSLGFIKKTVSTAITGNSVKLVFCTHINLTTNILQLFRKI